MADAAFLIPDWPAPANVRAIVTTRSGGISSGPFADFNLADHVGDDPVAVAENRRRLRAWLPAEPLWLQQVHGARCIDAALATPGIEADASFTRQPGVVCAVLTADCLPVLFCDEAGSVVAAAHAGWRGLAAGVLEATVQAMAVAPDHLLAWLGPAIGPASFEVGDEVVSAFTAQQPAAAVAFRAQGNGRWLCDLYHLARLRLRALGLCRITSAEFDTFRDAQRFFSYRREYITGRMASLVWRVD